MIGVAYVTVAVLFLRPVIGHIAWWLVRAEGYRRSYHGRTIPNGEDWFNAGILGLLASAIWPVTLVWVLQSRWAHIGEERRRDKDRKTEERKEALANAEAELAEAHRRLERLGVTLDE